MNGAVLEEHTGQFINYKISQNIGLKDDGKSIESIEINFSYAFLSSNIILYTQNNVTIKDLEKKNHSPA